jgi:hypothetical protein
MDPVWSHLYIVQTPAELVSDVRGQDNGFSWASW